MTISIIVITILTFANNPVAFATTTSPSRTITITNVSPNWDVTDLYIYPTRTSNGSTTHVYLGSDGVFQPQETLTTTLDPNIRYFTVYAAKYEGNDVWIPIVYIENIEIDPGDVFHLSNRKFTLVDEAHPQPRRWCTEQERGWFQNCMDF